MITVGVGPEDVQTFDVNEDLLKRHSEFFRAALSRDWKEKEERCVKLPEDDPETFKLFVPFAYTGKVFSARENDFRQNEYGTGHTDREYRRISTAWELADKVASTSFKDALVNTLVAKVTRTARYPMGMQDTIYPVSQAQAGIRKLLVDIAVQYGSGLTRTFLPKKGPSAHSWLISHSRSPRSR